MGLSLSCFGVDEGGNEIIAIRSDPYARVENVFFPVCLCVHVCVFLNICF